MALRWSAQLLLGSGYKHGAPTEHFTAEQQSENDFCARPVEGKHAGGNKS
jgi:hypothetical protein